MCPAQRPLKSLLTLGTRLYLERDSIMLSQKSNASSIITGEIILVVARQMKKYIDVTVHTDIAVAKLALKNIERTGTFRVVNAPSYYLTLRANFVRTMTFGNKLGTMY